MKQNWRERQQRVFDELKKRFTIEPVLIAPDLDKKMRVKANMLDFAIGEVLLMRMKSGSQQPIFQNY